MEQGDEGRWGRRRVLVGLAAATLAGIGGSARAATSGGPVLMRKVPSTGESLPAIGLGTWQAFDVAPGSAEFADARAALARYAGLGGRVVDTSPMYGRAEAALGPLLADVDASRALFLATKIWTRGKAEGERQLADSIARIGRKPLDLVQIHNLLDIETQLKTLRAAQADGRVRLSGITHYTAGAHEDLARWLERERFDFLQVNYSLAEPEADARLLDLAAARGTAVLVNRPLAEGGIVTRVRSAPLAPMAVELGCANNVQVCLKWILGHPAVTCALVGTRKLAHIEDNLAAARGPMPDATQRRAIARWYGGL